MNDIQVWQSLRNMGIEKTLAEVQNLISQVDLNGIVNKHVGRCRVEVWDRVSPVNGVPAEVVLQRSDIPEDGEVYFIYIDNNLVIFQPHSPYESGISKITEDNLVDISSRHVRDIMQSQIDGEFLEAVVRLALS